MINFFWQKSSFGWLCKWGHAIIGALLIPLTWLRLKTQMKQWKIGPTKQSVVVLTENVKPFGTSREGKYYSLVATYTNSIPLAKFSLMCYYFQTKSWKFYRTHFSADFFLSNLVVFYCESQITDWGFFFRSTLFADIIKDECGKMFRVPNATRWNRWVMEFLTC